MEAKVVKFDFYSVRKCVNFARRYEEDVYLKPYWEHKGGERKDEGEGEATGLRVERSLRTYYLKSRWPNKRGIQDDTLLPLAVRWYYDGGFFRQNDWESDDEEGVKQFFSAGEDDFDYEYASTWTAKDSTHVAVDEVYVPYKGVVKRTDELMMDWGTQIHVPGENVLLTHCDLLKSRFDPYAPNCQNKHKYPHLVKAEVQEIPPFGTPDANTPSIEQEYRLLTMSKREREMAVEFARRRRGFSTSPDEKKKGRK